jgi:hypothetical protein
LRLERGWLEARMWWRMVERIEGVEEAMKVKKVYGKGEKGGGGPQAPFS